MKSIAYAIAVGVVALLISACTSTSPAPVVERQSAGSPSSPKPSAPSATPPSNPALGGDSRPEYYVVKKGDTLYSIALDHGVGSRDIAEWNSIGNTDVIRVGDLLRVRPPVTGTVTTPLKVAPAVEAKPVTGNTPPAVGGAKEAVKTQPKGIRLPYSDQALAQLSGQSQLTPTVAPPGAAPTLNPPPEAKPGVTDEDKVDWSWPSGGKMLSEFNENTNLKGISIGGKLGEAVIASAPGRVLYSGDGIRGYGKLVIIKHNNTYLSVYAHNSQLLVKEGQTVAKGQKIAEMGNSDSDQVKLHFEIRRFGKPIDPLKLLPARPG